MNTLRFEKWARTEEGELSLVQSTSVAMHICIALKGLSLCEKERKECKKLLIQQRKKGWRK